MRDVIQKMLEAEAEAKRLLADAEAASERLLADARQKAQHGVELARTEGRAEADRILETARQEADRERDERVRQAAAAIQTEITVDEAVHRRGVEAVVRAVCGKSSS